MTKPSREAAGCLLMRSREGEWPNCPGGQPAHYRVRRYAARGGAPCDSGKSSAGNPLRYAGLNTLVDLFAVYFDVLGRLDAQFDLAVLDTHDGYGDVVINADGFANAAGEDQHGVSP